MNAKILFLLQDTWLLLLLICSVSVNGQTIGVPAVNAAGGPISIEFSVTNGIGTANHFSGSTLYSVYLSDASGSNYQLIHTFQSESIPAPTNLAQATVSRIIPIPSGTPSGSGYRLAVSSLSPASMGITGGNASAPFTLFCNFTMATSLNGFIKCSSPAITFYVMSITNTGNTSDSYQLTRTQSLYPLGSQFLTLGGAAITATPVIDPAETYTFMMRFDTPNGTPPDNWNTTIVTATSSNCVTVSKTTNISTYIYCGNNNSNLPDAPDMEVVKTTLTGAATVGEFLDYTITIKNNSTKNAQNPVIRDFIPANATLISYSKSAGETRNVLFSYDASSRILTALVQSSMTSANLPLTINVRLSTNCSSVPQVVNSAEVYTVSGDSNNINDVSSAVSQVSFNLGNAQLGLWTGAHSNDWFDCRNWSGGVVPNQNINVTIPPAVNSSNISTLSVLAPADKVARAHHVSVSPSGELSMTNAGLLDLKGNFSVDGTFSAGNGTVTFSGPQQNSYQSISSSANTLSFYNLRVDAPADLGISIPDQFGLVVTNDLLQLNGDIRLNGKSQFIQTKPGADTNQIVNGKLMIDQQGQSNIFSYNYWSSPVGSSNSYTVASVLRDGTNPANPQPITWTQNVNAYCGTPITLSSFWLNKYQNQSSSYANWSYLGPNGVLTAGQGYTMKGSGSLEPQQNYTFMGAPNNGNFSIQVSANNMNLSGNPYPCALDAYTFIDDNVNTTTGTLYFWEQYTTNSSHITAHYEGGYATLTKTGATPPSSPYGISNAGSSNRVPGRYVPVAQGFLIFGSETGGSVNFNNSQRAFVQEDDEMSNPLFRGNEKSINKKLRIGFVSSTFGMKRQLLIGYMGSQAGPDYDRGYDAVQIDTQKTDAFFPLAGKKLVILGEGAFSTSAAQPLTIVMATPGNATISLDATENFSQAEQIFLYDSATQSYYDLRSANAVISLPAGVFEDRFSIRFTNPIQTKVVSESGLNQQIQYAEGQLRVSNPDSDLIESLTIFDVSGKVIRSYKIDSKQEIIFQSVTGVVSGIYFAWVRSGKGIGSIQFVVSK